jgi:hypothetical protein
LSEIGKSLFLFAVPFLFLRRDIHANPEPGFAVAETVDRIKTFLEVASTLAEAPARILDSFI